MFLLQCLVTRMVNQNDMELLQSVSVLGWPGRTFYLLHGVPLVSIGLSLTASVGVLLFLNIPPRNLWHRSIAERLAIYTAVCDLLYR